MPERVPYSLSKINPSCALLLRAIGTPENCLGTGRCMPVLIDCLTAAKDQWQDSHLDQWLLPLAQLDRELRELAATGAQEAVSIFRAAPPGDGIQADFQRWVTSSNTNNTEKKLDAILGRTIVLASQSRQRISPSLLAGLNTLRLAHRGKGRRSKDWIEVLAIDWFEPLQVRSMLERLGPESPCFSFLAGLALVLEEGIQTPEADHDAPHAARSPDDSASGDSPDTTSKDTDLRAIHDSDNSTAITANKEPIATEARVSARLEVANYSSAGEKLGLPHRDHLLLKDLSQVTRNLMIALKTASAMEVGFAALALTSLVTGTTDHFLLKMSLAPAPDRIWLDLEKGAWAWDFAAYRQRDGLQDSSDVEPILIPLPTCLVQLLRLAKSKNPCTKTVKDLILAIQNASEFDSEGFRGFLKAQGNTAHPAYRGRFARSIQTAFLEITGSDMLAGLLTAHFSCTAPAALYYFGPTYSTIYKYVRKVYEILGLGDHSTPCAESLRAGCQKIPTLETCNHGWDKLIDATNQTRTLCLAEKDPIKKHQFASDWMEHLCAAFIESVAHRGTRLEQLTCAALLSSSMLGVVHDKDDTIIKNRAHPRAVPWTRTTCDILMSAVECHSVMNEASCAAAAPVRFKADDPLFVSFTPSGSTTKIQAIQSRRPAELIYKYFDGAALNFGRSMWVTALDEIECDRWLIRSLTGHTRDVTRVTDSYFDIPIVEIAKRLAPQMENVSHQWFGSAAPIFESKTYAIKPRKIASVANTRGGHVIGVPDPRVLLDPLNSYVLQNWSQACAFRANLATGSLDAPPHVLSVLHLLFLDLVPDAALALEALEQKSCRFTANDPRPGLAWKRPHFVHDTWIPIRASTWRLVEQAQKREWDRSTLLRDISNCITTSQFGTALPTDPSEIWATLVTWSKGFRRLELPPSLLAASHLDVPAPTLNPLSIARIAGIPAGLSEKNTPTAPRLVRPTGQRHGKKPDDIKEMSRILNKYSRKDQRHGERRQRAILARKDIANLHVGWTAGGIWIRELLEEELKRTRDFVNGSYEISTLNTYIGTLTRPTNWNTGTDPYDWDEDDWIKYVELVDQASRRYAPPCADGKDLSDQARPALYALVRSLVRRGHFVPHVVFKRLNGPHEDQGPADSASSVLITSRDQERAIQITGEWLRESPATNVVASIRATVSRKIPMRSGDISSLTTDCLTPAGGLVTQRVGFTQHKTDAAIRVIPIDQDLQQELIALRAELQKYVGEQELLTRGDGNQVSVDRDDRGLQHWTQALKLATGDHKARPHSVRAASLQEIAWPNWQHQAELLLNGKLSVREARDWTTHLQEDWTRLAAACVCAGQADIRSALGNYLAGWPIVHAIHALSINPVEQPTPNLLRQLDVNGETLRQARSRHRRKSLRDSNFTAKEFCAWTWIESTDINSQRPKASLSTSTKQETPRKGGKEAKSMQTGPLSQDQSAKYLMLRSLGMPMEATLTTLAIDWSAALALEPLVPDSDQVEASIRRARNAPNPRGVRGNLDTCLSEVGSDILAWLLRLNSELFSFAFAALIRESKDVPVVLSNHENWALLSAGLPSGLSITIRKGATHITQDEVVMAHGKAQRYQLIGDPKLGARPVVSLMPLSAENRVVSSRLTAVARVGLLSIRSIRALQENT